MTLKALVVAGALAAASWNIQAAAVRQPAAPTSGSDPRLEQLEHWLGALLHHSPGLIDDEIVVVGKRSNIELQTLSVDASTLVRVLRNPSLASPNGRFTVTVPNDRPGQAPRVLQYTPPEISRLKQLACAVGGFIDAAPCEWTKFAVQSDPVLSSLSKAATAVRHEMNANFILRRGALMHTDVVLMGLAWPAAINTNPGQQSVRMSISDGHQAGLSEGDLHWEFARKLLDLIAGPVSVKPAPGGDDMVRGWYIATTAWMQSSGHHDNAHVNHAREIFPDDAELAMLAGAQHEAYATPAVQTAVRTAVLPTGFKLDVASERDELKDAEKLLRRATELKPDFAEAQIRLGRTLSVTGRDTEAVEHLKRGLDATDEKLLQYYGSLFLGAAEEKLGHNDAAHAAYQRAATLFPTAQSPLLGLSQLARRAGRRDEALREMEKVYGMESGSLDADPWWTYGYAQGRNADSLIESVRKPFRLIDAP
jgi:tetratricopeptide (TPR) repeat protein